MTLLLNRELLKFVPALRQLDLNCIISLMQCLNSKVYLPGEFVFKAGDSGTHLYLVKTGRLSSADEKRETSLCQPSDKCQHGPFRFLVK